MKKIESIKTLKKTCQPKNQNTEERIKRAVSIHITRLLLHTNITGNQVTLLNMFLGIVAGIFFAWGIYLCSFVGAVLLYVCRIIDRVDGEVARYRKKMSRTGVYIDKLNDIIISPYILICITFGIYNMFHNVTIFIFGFLASFSILFLDYVSNLKYAIIAQTYGQTFQDTSSTDSSFKDVFSKNYSIYNIYNISKTVFNSFKLHGFMHIILLSTIIDLIFKLNVLSLIFIMYATISPIIWIRIAFLNVKNKLPDGLYNEMIK